MSLLVSFALSSVAESDVLDIVSSFFAALWGLVVLGGLLTILWTSHQEEKDRQIAAGTRQSRAPPPWFTTFTDRLHSRNNKRHSSSSYYPSSCPFSYPTSGPEKIKSLSEAFAPPLAAFGTPLPSPQPTLQPDTVKHESFFQMDGGNASSSKFPWLLRGRAGVLGPGEGNEESAVVPMTNASWRSKIASRLKKDPPRSSPEPELPYDNNSSQNLPPEALPIDGSPPRLFNSTSPASDLPPPPARNLPSLPKSSPVHNQYHTVPTPTTNAYPNVNPIYSRFASAPLHPTPQPSRLRQNPPLPPSRLQQYQAQQASTMAAARNPFEESEKRVSAPVRDPFRTPFDDPTEV